MGASACIAGYLTDRRGKMPLASTTIVLDRYFLLSKMYIQIFYTPAIVVTGEKGIFGLLLTKCAPGNLFPTPAIM